MAAIDSRIDELYQKPLDEFTAARNALAKTLGRTDAQRVRHLPKPTLVPWTVNQLYWRARGTFDRLRKAGEKLRAAQIAALKGRRADVRPAAEAQRRAIAEASLQAMRLAAQTGSHPNADELMRTLEALSLAAHLPEAPGRMTRPLRPAGFEALAGVKPAVIARKAEALPHTSIHPKGVSSGSARRDAQLREAREADTDREKREAEISAAEAAVDRANAAEAQAREAWERAKLQVAAAERRLAGLTRNRSRSS